MDYISDTHLDLLENIIQLVCPVLRETISQFKAQQGETAGFLWKTEGQGGRSQRAEREQE